MTPAELDKLIERLRAIAPTIYPAGNEIKQIMLKAVDALSEWRAEHNAAAVQLQHTGQPETAPPAPAAAPINEPAVKGGDVNEETRLGTGNGHSRKADAVTGAAHPSHADDLELPEEPERLWAVLKMHKLFATSDYIHALLSLARKLKERVRELEHQLSYSAEEMVAEIETDRKATRALTLAEIGYRAEEAERKLAEAEQKLDKIGRLAATGTVINWLKLPDEEKARWFALMIIESRLKKEAMSRVNELECKLAERDHEWIVAIHDACGNISPTDPNDVKRCVESRQPDLILREIGHQVGAKDGEHVLDAVSRYIAEAESRAGKDREDAELWRLLQRAAKAHPLPDTADASTIEAWAQRLANDVKDAND